MFLWRSLDPRTVTSVLDWMAERQRGAAKPVPPATAASRPVPAEDRAAPGRARPRVERTRR
ncbi:MAG: hypothetical protein ACM3N5_01940 [Candidatus Eiseniibacteriota bacterium]